MSRTTDHIVGEAAKAGKPVKFWLRREQERLRREREEAALWAAVESREYFESAEDDEIQEVS